MVTFAQAQERAEEWVNGDVPAYQHREVRVREFELGFVVWAEDRAEGPVSDGGRQRLVIARDSGEATLWPALPVGEVIRRYEEEYGALDAAPAAPEPPQRIDLNQTSFLLSPPEWLQEAADKLGIPDQRAERSEDARPASPPLLLPLLLLLLPRPWADPGCRPAGRRGPAPVRRPRMSPPLRTASRPPRRMCRRGPPRGRGPTPTRTPTTGRSHCRPPCSRRRSRVPMTTAPRRRRCRRRRRPR